MDVEMKSSLDDLIKKDKKFLRKVRPGQKGAAGKVGKGPQRFKNKGAAIFKGKNSAGKQQQQRPEKRQSNTGKGAALKVRQPLNKKFAGRGNKTVGKPVPARQLSKNDRKQRLQDKLDRRQNSKAQRVQGKGQGQQRQQRQQVQRPQQKQIQQQRPQKTQVATVMTKVDGAINQRKVKVRNIDANTVTSQDLKTLFSKSGPLISADFDKNIHGQYLGSATLVYSAPSGAANCIRTYNGAQLDDRVMKIEFAGQGNDRVQHVKSGGKTLQIQKAPRQSPSIRKGNNNGIRKNRNGPGAKKAGKTLNLTGSSRRDNNRRKRSNSGAGDTGAGGNKRGGRRSNSRKFN